MQNYVRRYCDVPVSQEFSFYALESGVFIYAYRRTQTRGGHKHDIPLESVYSKAVRVKLACP